jgi:phosphatidylserine/phosphatidylglycerophosphate/cardiolipin synthase-like enzyme
MGAPIYVHAKLMIVDDEILRIGSANMNNRSLGLDSECDIFIDAKRPGNESAAPGIRMMRATLLAEHCGLSVEKVAQLLGSGTAMREIIENHSGNGRRLCLLELAELTDIEKALAENAVLDPATPDEMFEPFSSPGLFARARKLYSPG